MPLYQNSSVATNKLILGNFKVEVGASVAATVQNVGAGMITAINHEPTLYDTQAGNAPDPVKGVASETIKVSMEMIEYDASVLNVIYGGLLNMSTASSVQTIHAGGNADSAITPKFWRFTNTKYPGGTTVQTIFSVYYATPDAGPGFTLKSDNDTDPIAVMPLSITGEVDPSRAAGRQLYTITYDVKP